MALLLRDVVGLSYTEIADSLEITLATVKWRIYKAREEVQLALAREGITFGRAEAARERPSAPAFRSSAALLDPVREPLRERRGETATRASRACVRSTGYSTRWKRARCLASKSSTSQAARGSPSRGWPTDPGLSSQRPRSSSVSWPAGARPPCSSSVVEHDRERHVTVPDEHDRRLGHLAATSARRPRLSTYSQTGSRGLAWKSSAPSTLRSGSRLQIARGSSSSDGLGPARRRGRVGREVVEVESFRARRGRGCRRGRCLRARGRARNTGSAPARSRRGRRGTRPRRAAPRRSPRGRLRGLPRYAWMSEMTATRMAS